MSTATPEDVRKHVRVYLLVFASLMVLTVVTVAVSFLNMPVAAAIAVAILIATIKGSLVACYFMHLISEKAVIYWVLILMVVFFTALMVLPIMTVSEVAGANYVS